MTDSVMISLIGAAATVLTSLANGLLNRHKIRQTHDIVVDTKNLVDGRLGQFLNLEEKVTNANQQERRYWTETVRGQRAGDNQGDPRTFRRSWNARMKSPDPDDYK